MRTFRRDLEVYPGIVEIRDYRQRDGRFFKMILYL